MFEAQHFRLFRHEFQAARNAFVRLAIQVRMVPVVEARRVGPEGERPDFLWMLERAENFHPNEACRVVDQVRPLPKSLLDVLLHPVGDRETPEGAERAGVFWRGCARRRQRQ